VSELMNQLLVEIPSPETERGHCFSSGVVFRRYVMRGFACGGEPVAAASRMASPLCRSNTRLRG
jgi:hypothetical protein